MRTAAATARLVGMIRPRNWARRTRLVLCLFLLFPAGLASARSSASSKDRLAILPASKKLGQQDDSLTLKPAKDLVLRPEGQHKADALAHFVEGMSLEENGEIDKALQAYRKVLNVDPGQVELACRVAAHNFTGLDAAFASRICQWPACAVLRRGTFRFAKSGGAF